MYVWYRMIWCVRHITLTCNTAALVPRAVCSSRRSTVQKWKNMRTVPSRRENKNVPPVPSKRKSNVSSGRGRNYLPSRPVVKNYMHRPVPSRQFLFTVPSRRDIFYLPFRPIMKQKRSLHCTVPSRREISHSPSRAVPFNQLQSSLFYRRVHSCHCFPRQTCQNSPVPSRLEYYRPWKALVVLAYHLLPLTCYIPRSTSKYVVFWRIWMAVFVFWLVTTEHVPIIIYNPWCDEGFCMNRTIKRPNSKTKAHHWCQRKRKYICRMQKQIEHGETGW